ncbi:hypothetical protein BGZ93_003041 [Podila epicladia]|nr:hypothetical protein BGZ93_003041 [Podila epicladia]
MISADIENMEAALADFRLQRCDQVKIQHKKSKTNTKVIYEQGCTIASLTAFLPLAPPRGQGPFFQQQPSAKYLKLQAAHAKAERERADLEDNAMIAVN